MSNVACDFFSCIAGQVRDMVGQQLEFVKDWNQISPEERNQQTTTKQKSNTQHKPKHQARQTYQANLQTKWNKWNIRALLSPSNVLVHRVVLLQVVQWLDVSHIYICTWILRRVSRRHLLIWYVPSLVCHLFAQFSMNASTSDCATASLPDSAFNNSLKSLTMFQCKMNGTLSGSTRAPS